MVIVRFLKISRKIVTKSKRIRIPEYFIFSFWITRQKKWEYSLQTQLYLWLLTHTQAAVKAAERVPQAYRILG